MSISKPTARDLRFARDEFRKLLKAKAKESYWQNLFAEHPYVLSSALPLRMSPHVIVPLGRPGRSEPDFVFYPKEPSPLLTYGVVELKRPNTEILTKPRRDTFVLSRDAATALAQAKGYARQLTQQLTKNHSANLFFGNHAYIFLIMGLSEELARTLPANIQHDVLQELLPQECRLIPYDTLLKMFEENVPPLVISLSPDSEVEDDSPQELALGEQLKHQLWADPKRHSIQLDVPPGVYPRPPELFLEVIDATGLRPDDFERWERPLFGAMEFLVKANEDAVRRFRTAQPILEQRIQVLYETGGIRGGSWG